MQFSLITATLPCKIHKSHGICALFAIDLRIDFQNYRSKLSLLATTNPPKILEGLYGVLCGCFGPTHSGKELQHRGLFVSPERGLCHLGLTTFCSGIPKEPQCDPPPRIHTRRHGTQEAQYTLFGLWGLWCIYHPRWWAAAGSPTELIGEECSCLWVCYRVAPPVVASGSASG